MAFAILDKLVKNKDIQLDYATAEKNYIKSICKGLFKIMSKMGISTIRSYRGAKIFEAIGLSEELSKAYFGGLGSPIGGIRLEEVTETPLLSIMKDLQQRQADYYRIKVCILSVKTEKNMPGILKQSVHYSWPPVWVVTRNLRNTLTW